MKSPISKGMLAAGAWLLFSLPLSLGAQTLLLDFGTAATNTSSTLNPLGVTGTWNSLAADASSGLVFSDGSASTVTVDLGKVANATQLSFSTTLTAATGSSLTTGIYGPSSSPVSPARDYVAATSTGAAANIAGLGAGTYDVYIASTATSSTSPAAATIYAGNVAASAIGSFNTSTLFTFSGLASTTELNSTAGNWTTGTWIDGVNYVKITVTLGAGDDLVVAAYDGATTAPLNMIEVVAVPEPGTVWLLLGGASLLAVAAMRRRFAPVRA